MTLRDFFWTDQYLLVLALFLIFFLIIPIFANKKWYNQNPRGEFRDENDQNELIKNTLEHHKYLESTSYVLSGSALVGLTFIISMNYDDVISLNSLEPAITFFAIAFILETISAVSFHNLRKNFWGYFGQVFQYAGMLSILMGFEVFIFSQTTLNWSILLQVVFPIGMSVIIYLTFEEFKAKILFLHRKRND